MTPPTETLRRGQLRLEILRDEYDDPYINLMPICRQLGLDWITQYEALLAHDFFSLDLAYFGDMGLDKWAFVGLPPEMFLPFLFTIPVHSVSPERRRLLYAYQRESLNAMRHHWNGRPIWLPRGVDPDLLSDCASAPLY